MFKSTGYKCIFFIIIIKHYHFLTGLALIYIKKDLFYLDMKDPLMYSFDIFYT